MLQGRGGHKSVGCSHSGLAPQPTRTLRNRSIHLELLERFQKALHHVFLRLLAGEELATGHHRIVQPVGSRFETSGAPQVIDEYVGIDQQVSHGPTRRDSGPGAQAGRRR